MCFSLLWILILKGLGGGFFLAGCLAFCGLVGFAVIAVGGFAVFGCLVADSEFGLWCCDAVVCLMLWVWVWFVV